MYLIFQLTHTASSVRQLKNKNIANNLTLIIMMLERSNLIHLVVAIDGEYSGVDFVEIS